MLLLMSVKGYSQQPDSSLVGERLSYFDTFKEDAATVFGGVRAVYTHPLLWKKNDLILAGAAGLGSGVLYLYDDETSDYFTRQRENIPGVLRETGNLLSPKNLLALDGAIYLSGLFLKQEKIRHTGLLLITSATASGILLTLSKNIVGRARPKMGEGKGSFKPFSFKDDYSSFLSGHSLFAVTTAYAIGKQFKNPFIKAGIYSFGLIGPFSRVWEGEHWLSDVTMSAVLGVAIVETVNIYLEHQEEKDKTSRHKIVWKLNLGYDQVGLTGTF